MERGWREMSPNCPRCGSINTKFCYYNNYSLSQPRYFCKGCRRYWTKGGSLRNVPIGGGCRKSRRSRPWSSLRLQHSSNNNHHNPNILSHAQNHHAHNNTQLSHSTSPTNLIQEESTTTTSTEAPKPNTIDLAVVYANFLNQKPNINNDNVAPPSNITGFVDSLVAPLLHDQTLTPPIPPLFQNQQHTISMLHCNHNDDNNNLPSSSSSNKEIISTSGLPSLSWSPPPPFNGHPPGLLDPGLELELDPDAPFSNCFTGSWSALDLPGFENTSSIDLD